MGREAPPRDDQGSGPPVLRPGDRGPAVAALRARLVDGGLLTRGPAPHGPAPHGPAPHGPAPHEAHPPASAAGRDVFDAAVERAVRAFQQSRGLTATGVVDPPTRRLLDEAGWSLGDRELRLVAEGLLAGDDVMALQRRLLELGFDVGRPDGRFGSATERGLRDFQLNLGLVADGVVGPSTLHALRRLRPLVTGGRAHALREAEDVRRAGPRLPGKAVVLDAGHGGPDRGCHGHGLVEADLTADVVERISARLRSVGVRVVRTRGPAPLVPLDEVMRARVANDAGADLLLSLHCDAAGTSVAQGVATFYYGDDRHGASSVVGEAFAGLLQRELVARTGLVDLRSHPRTWDLLRRTRMPAVRLELGYLTSPVDAQRLRDPGVRDVVAEAVVIAVQRVYLPREQDATTGALRLQDLAAP